MSVSAARVLLLAAGVDSPSFRFRVRQYLPYLKAQSIQATIGDLAVPTQQRRQLLATAGDYDAVLVHRALLRTPDFLALRRHARQYVFDVDDAIMFRDSAHRRMRSWQRMWRFRRMTRHAQTVIAGNEYLKSWSENVSAHTVVIPTCIELEDYPPTPPGGAQEAIIGWIGTRVNLMYLDTIRGALTRVGQGPKRPSLKVVCDEFPDVPGIMVEQKIWALHDESADVRSFQIGIMPLPDDVWTRGKCGLKLLQYMAASVPVICSPVGANCAIVEDGVNGFYANTEAEWVDRLERLLADAQLRARMGRAGRETVQARYAVANNAPRFIETLLPNFDF